VDRVAAEIAEEVGVLLQHCHATRAGKQEAGHDAGRPTADNDKIEFGHAPD
jgi:hypothetical protein